MGGYGKLSSAFTLTNREQRPLTNSTETKNPPSTGCLSSIFLSQQPTFQFLTSKRHGSLVDTDRECQQASAKRHAARGHGRRGHRCHRPPAAVATGRSGHRPTAARIAGRRPHASPTAAACVHSGGDGGLRRRVAASCGELRRLRRRLELRLQRRRRLLYSDIHPPWWSETYNFSNARTYNRAL